MTRLLLIINPKSGKGTIRSNLLEITDVFIKEGYDVTIYISQKVRDAREKVKKAARYYDLVICSGGDGTMDEVVEGMMRRKKKLPLGYIPSGTVNDFARSLKIPRNMAHAAEVAVHGNDFICDVGSFNGSHFVYIAAFGIFTDVAYSTSQDVKNVLGNMAYLLEGVKRLTNIPSYHVRLKSAEYEGEGDFIFGMVTNSRSVGGFKNIIGRHVRFDDGVFEVTFVRTPKTPLEVQEILAAIVLKEMDSKYMVSFCTANLEIFAEQLIPWTLDGEYGGNYADVVIKNHQKALLIRTGN